MSTATPTKHDRTERHIQRQRGAGVRSLATSFGFSFGLSTAVSTVAATLETSQSQEPPAKRRKSHESARQSALLAPKSTTTVQHGMHNQLHRTAQYAETRQRLEDVQEKPGCRICVEADDDTLAQAVKRPQKPRKIVTEPATSQNNVELATEPAAKKRGRPKKVHGLEHTAEQDTANKKDTAHVIAVIAARVAMDSFVVDPAAANVSLRLESQAKRRDRPKKKAADEEKDALPCQTPGGVCLQPSRPKRHAATTAMMKVSDGFQEEESDITKKRRNVTAPSKSALNVNAVLDDRGEGSLVEPSTERVAKAVPKKTRAKKQASTNTPARPTRSVETNKAEIPFQCADQASRGAADVARRTEVMGDRSARPQRRAATAAKIKVTEGFSEEASDVSKKRRDAGVPTHADSDIYLVRSAAANGGDTTPDLSPQPHATDGGKSDVVIKPRMAKQATVETAGVVPIFSTRRPPLAEAGVNIRSHSVDKPALEEGKLAPKLLAFQPTAYTATVRSSKPATSDVKKRKAASVLVGCEPASVKEIPKGSIKPSNTATEAIPVTGCKNLAADRAATSDLKSNHDVQDAQQVPLITKAGKLKHKEPTQKLPGSEEVLLEDVDWLFEKPVTRRGGPAGGKRKQAVKREHRVVRQISDVDLDLDDLLSNIANFTPRTVFSDKS